MAVIGVTNTNDDGIGSLRRAIEIANSTSEVDTIRIGQNLEGLTVTLTSGELRITSDLVIQGLGADRFTVSGNGNSRVFSIDDNNDASQVHVEINDIAIVDGSLPNTFIYGSGIYNEESLKLNRTVIRENMGAAGGAGIGNRGNLVVQDSAILDNQSMFVGNVGTAAGITNLSTGTAEIVNSLIRGNSTFRGGGGIYNAGVLSILNSTVVENSIDATKARSGFGGAGILNTAEGNLLVDSSTIVDNEIQLSFEDLEDENLRGVGIRTNSNATTTITNSIVANNINTSDLFSDDENNDVFGTFDSEGYNLIGAEDGSSGFNAIGDQTGTTASPLDPELRTLAENGGFTETLLPRVGSPVIDAGSPSNNPATDQRGIGFPRRIDGDGNGSRISDIGAAEFNPAFSIASGTSGDDSRSTGDLDDLLRGFDGDDTLDAGSGNDVIEGGDGNDVLNGRQGNDAVFGGRGNDRLIRNQGNDTLIGGPGLDTIEGGGGRDLIIWNAGDSLDRISGGSGRDTVEVNGASGGRDDFRIAAGGPELLISSPGDSLLGLTIDGVERLELNGGGGNDRLRVENISSTAVNNIQFDAGKGNDTLLGANSSLRLNADGGEGRDILIGSNFNDQLSGGDGNDIILGFDGNDILNGGLGNDAVVGGDGNDFISENGGNDILTGGAGADRFAFFGNTNITDGLEPFGRDVIRDFERGVDSLELLFFAGLDFGDLDSNSNGVLDGGDSLITIGGGNTRILLGNFFAQLSTSHTIQLNGVTGLTSSDITIF